MNPSRGVPEWTDPKHRDTAVMVFAKLPVAGSVKTRLAQRIGATEAAAFAEAFLADTLARVRAVAPGTLWLWGDQPSPQRFRRFLLPRIRYRSQGEGSLGDRLLRGFRTVFRGGARGAIALGADTPHLPLERLAQACRWVRRGHAVLGPARDGGYYLLGLPREFPQAETLFSGVEWGSDHVLAATRRRLGERSFPWKELRPFWDIDHWDDLVQWAKELKRVGPPDPPPSRSLAVLERFPVTPK